MKNPRLERLRRKMREYHRHHLWRLDGGLFIPHTYLGGCSSVKRPVPTSGRATTMDVIRGYLKPACGNVAEQKRSDAAPQVSGPGKQFRSVRPQLAAP